MRWSLVQRQKKRAMCATACAILFLFAAVSAARGDEVSAEAAPLEVRSLAFSSDGGLLAVACGLPEGAGRLIVWDVAQRARRYVNDWPVGVASVAVSPDGALIAVGGYDHRLRLLDAASGEPRLELTGHQGAVRGLAFSPDGAVLASASWDQTVRLWEVASGQESRSLTGHKERMYSVAFSPDGSVLASGGLEPIARLWNTATGELVREINHFDFVSPCVAFSPDGRRLATACYDGKARIWDAATGKLWMKITSEVGGVAQLAFSPDGRLLALCGTLSPTVPLFEVLNDETTSEIAARVEQLVARLDHDDFSVREETSQALVKLGMHADAALAEAASSPSAEVRIRARRIRQQVRSPAPVRVLKAPSPVHYAAFSPQDSLIAGGCQDGNVYLWNAVTGEEAAVPRQAD